MSNHLAETTAPSALKETTVSGESLEHQQNGPEDAVQQLTTETAEQAEAVIEVTTKLPPSVREEAQKLFQELLASKKLAEDARARWTKSEPDKKRLVRLASLLHEYASSIPELEEKLGKNINPFNVRRFTTTYSPIDDVEERVIKILREELITIKQREPEVGRRTVDDDQKRYIVTICRLLQKKALGTAARNDYLNTIGVATNLPSGQWQKLFEDENGFPKQTTEELIQGVFDRARRELKEEQEPEETGLASVSSQEPVEKDQTLQPVSSEAEVEASPQEPVEKPTGDRAVATPAEIHKAPPAPKTNLELADALAEQNRQMIALLASANGESANRLIGVIEANAESIRNLLGASGRKQEQGNNDGNDEGLVLALGGKHIHVPADAMGTIRVTEFILGNDEKGSQE